MIENNEWQEVSEDGVKVYVHEKLGNIIQISETMYVSCMPIIAKLGPFKTLDEAKAVLGKKQEVKMCIEQFNLEVTKGK